MIQVGILGATGYVGLELTRLLLSHPQAELRVLCSQSYEGQAIQDIYPSLRGVIDTVLTGTDYNALAACDVVFTALPHGAACEAVTELNKRGVKVIDMSADFRYDDAETYKQWYGLEHQNVDLMQKAVYGLPEMHREAIKKAEVVANPGCYTTSSILAIAPLLRAGVIQSDNIIVDSKSGTSGAGAKPSANTSFCEVDESLKAYSVTTHRHTSEIEQEISKVAEQEIKISFTPHLLPIKRGILSTIYANLSAGRSVDDVEKAYTIFKDEPFVLISKHGDLPQIKHVTGSNYCAIGYQLDARLNRLVIVSCLDNLIKGAAGQAVQNMNLLFGLDETTALAAPAWYL